MGNTGGKSHAVEPIKELIDGIGTCVLSLLKTRVTGDRPDAGKNDTVQL